MKVYLSAHMCPFKSPSNYCHFIKNILSVSDILWLLLHTESVRMMNERKPMFIANLKETASIRIYCLIK